MNLAPQQLLSLSILLAVILIAGNVAAQENNIRGIVTDTAEKKKLQFAIVALIDRSDTSLFHSGRTDENGVFSTSKIPSGKYTLMISFPKMADFLYDVTITDTSRIDLGQIPMINQSTLLQEVVVKSGMPIRMRGDTLEYAADSFAVRLGDNVEQLLKRLPGIYVERNGRIYAQGKKVERVLVDGDEFFSDDPGLASKYLRADAVDKVQVFDGQSEQSQFTGIDDGKRTTTINLKLKRDKKSGVFGKLSAGGDGKDYHQYEAMGAYFTGSQKISVFGLASRTGSTQLNYSEMSQYVNQDYEVINDGTGNMVYSSGDGEGVFNNSGLPSILYGGAHYSDKWNNAKQKLFANYRVRQNNTTDWENSSILQVLPDGSSFLNKGDNTSRSYDFFQKASASFTTTLDSFSTLKISVNGNNGNSNSNSSNLSSSVNEKGYQVNDSKVIEERFGRSRKFGSNLTYQRGFRKLGRTLSLSLQQDYSKTERDNTIESVTNYYDPSTAIFTRADSLNQLQKASNPFESYAGKAMYTDKISKEMSIAAEYGWKRMKSSNIFNTFSNKSGQLQERIDSLSNDYDFISTTHITGATISWVRNKLNLTAGTKVFLSRFDQFDNDQKSKIDRNFINWTPNVAVGLKLNGTSSLRFAYTGQTDQPSIEQLQPIRRTTNNLYVQLGNPGLKPSFRHNGSVVYSRFNLLKMQNWNVFINISYTGNSITSQSSIDAQNRTVSQYINMDGMVSYMGYFNFSWYLKKLNLRSSVNANLGRNGYYQLQNGERIKNESYQQGVNVTFNHDWKNVMTTGYSGAFNLNLGRSDVPGSKTNTSFYHTHTLTNAFFLPWKIELNSECVFSFQPRNDVFNTNFNNIIWNAGIQKKMLKNDAGIIRLSVDDILNRKTGYGRSVSGSNVYEFNRFVVKRYWLLTATWNFSRNL